MFKVNHERNSKFPKGTLYGDWGLMCFDLHQTYQCFLQISEDIKLIRGKFYPNC